MHGRPDNAASAPTAAEQTRNMGSPIGDGRMTVNLRASWPRAQAGYGLGRDGPLAWVSRVERPGPPLPRPRSETHDTEHQRAESKRDHQRRRRGDDEDASQQRGEARPRTEPPAIRPRHGRD